MEKLETPAVTIELGELKRIFEVLMNHLDALGYSEVSLDHDYYWNIPLTEIYEFDVEPSDLDLGQTSDDWAELTKIASGDSPPVTDALVWLSSILRTMGHETIG